MSLLPAINREAWRIKGANGLQVSSLLNYHHVERTWQDDRDLPDRSGPLAVGSKGSVGGLGGFSENPCPLARLRLGPPPPKTPPPPPDLPVGKPEVIRRYKAEFTKRDYQGAGEVSVRELQELMKATTGQDLRETAVKILVQKIDKDGSGSINFTEFLEGCFGIREPRPTDKPPLKPIEQVFKDMCEAIDRDDIKGMEKLIETCKRENMPPVLRAYRDTFSGLGIIHVAARSGSDRMVLLMVEHKADPNEPCRGQETPLHFAAQSTGKYRDRMVAVLLAAGAKRMARTSSGYTAIHLLAPESQRSCFEWHDDPKILDHFRHHRRKHHHAHGYHPMVPIADILKAGRHERRSRKHRHEHEDPEVEGDAGHRRHHRHKHHRHHHHHGEEEDLASKSGHRSSHTHRSHRSSHSRAKTNDEIKLLNWLEDDSDKDDLDDVRNLQTRGTNMSSSTKASSKHNLAWLERERVHFEKKMNNAARYSDSD